MGLLERFFRRDPEQVRTSRTEDSRERPWDCAVIESQYIEGRRGVYWNIRRHARNHGLAKWLDLNITSTALARSHTHRELDIKHDGYISTLGMHTTAENDASETLVPTL